MNTRIHTDLTEPVAGEEYEHDGHLVDVVEVGMEYVKVDYLNPSYEDAHWIDRAIVETEFVRTEPRS